ncbi:DUF4230 domain-containing protein [Flagellimonas myxillae]|uniref:DUF4230 domain-containing protein n=1 Tax=Flagellimonas myxillae TaxID=2942214 RepID=UPI00201EA0B2|nr:DUF4230 domain-containing protein [Muricauda myxillae]MCL6267804.1 DUF4230 domain-containing protein [Muricauda myxillae]
MKKILLGALIALSAILIYKSCTEYNQDKAILKESSLLLQQELKNVSKLIVTEGHFVEVYNYADSKELFGSLVTADKKALVVVNAEATISYDLSQLEIEVVEVEKTIRILTIPEPEIAISPDFEYYDVTADYFNPFNAEDYNAIKETVNESLRKKIEISSLKSNAENRLLSELSRIYVLSNSMGWTLEFNDKRVSEISTLLD